MSNLDQQIRSALADQAQQYPASPDAWGGLAHRLDAEPAARRRPIAAVAAAAAVAIPAVTVLAINSRSAHPASPAAAKPSAHAAACAEANRAFYRVKVLTAGKQQFFLALVDRPGQRSIACLTDDHGVRWVSELSGESAVQAVELTMVGPGQSMHCLVGLVSPAVSRVRVATETPVTISAGPVQVPGSADITPQPSSARHGRLIFYPSTAIGDAAPVTALDNAGRVLGTVIPSRITVP